MKNRLPRSERRRLGLKEQKKRYKAIRYHSWLLEQGLKKGEAVLQVACDFSISTRTLYRWLFFYKSGGKRNLSSFIPYLTPLVKTPSTIIEMILLLHDTFGFGCQKIAKELELLNIYKISGQGVYQLIKRFAVKKKFLFQSYQRRLEYILSETCSFDSKQVLLNFFPYFFQPSSAVLR